ncbi:MAG: hypothetical protein ABSD62_10545 [Candidatus Limnocylindrales bacterium]|jgi:hypothetical protein
MPLGELAEFKGDPSATDALGARPVYGPPHGTRFGGAEATPEGQAEPLDSIYERIVVRERTASAPLAPNG